MDYIRTMVSGKKRRFTDRKYNLDLSYITPRIIAMAYPASGFQIVFRNNIEEVSKFLKERHRSNYMVINLSGKKYDNNKFDNRVLEYQWVDHHAPPLKLLFDICHEIDEFIKANEENVVAINCRAGKGRTGTIICCYLLFSGRFQNPEEVLEYYSKKRFNVGEGVTQPSQKRYVYYFAYLLKEKIYFPLVRTIKAITINKIPSKSEGTIRPYFEIYLGNSDKLFYSNKKGFLEQKKIYSNNTELITITDSSFLLTVSGDLTIKIYNNEMLSTRKIGRVAFNTSFLDLDQDYLVFKLDQIDPDNLVKKKKIPRDFEIHIKFGRICDCKNSENAANLCKKCEDILSVELSDWRTIHTIIEKHKENTLEKSKVFLFGPFEEDDVEQVMTSNIDEAEIQQVDFEDGSDKPKFANSKTKEFEKQDDANASFENECLIY